MGEAERGCSVTAKTPLTDMEKSIVAKVTTASFPPATASKRFARDLESGYIKELSDKGRKFLAFVAHRFRRQYQLSKDEQEWVSEWLTKEVDVKNFFTKSTVEASCWCATCRKDTFHRVSGGRPSACLDCPKRLENPTLPGVVEPVATQMTLEEVYGSIEIK
jgi:hypothetical protein